MTTKLWTYKKVMIYVKEVDTKACELELTKVEKN